MNKILFQRVASLVLFGLLSACSATNDTTRFYTLKPAIIKTSIDNDEKHIHSLSIESLKIPRLINRPQIISRIGKNEIKRAEYHQWGGSIEEEIEHLILDTLNNNLTGSNLYLLPSESRVQPEYNLHLAINRLDGELGTEAHIEMTWLLETDQSGENARQGTINDTILLTNQTYGNYVAALQELIISSVKQLSKRLSNP